MSKVTSRRWLRWIGYAAWALFALGVCLYLTFPGDAVGQWVARKVHQQTQGKISLSLDGVSLYGLTGFEADRVKVTMRRRDGDALAVPLGPVQARLQILPLFLLKPVLAATVHLGAGSVSGTFGKGKDAVSVDVELDNVDFASPPVLGNMLNLPLTGVIGGKLALDWRQDPKQSSGQASLTLKQAAVGPGAIAPGLTLPKDMQLGQLDLALDLKEGRLRIASLQQKGEPNVQVRNVSGSATLRPQLGASSYDACLELKVDERLYKEYPKLEGMMLFAAARARKDSDGYLHVPLSGNFQSMPRMSQRLCSK